MDFVNLHTHTDIGSCLDGMSTVEEVFKRASELGQNAISITDHASTAALPYMIKYGEEYGVKPILGCEFYVVDDNDPLFGKRGENRMHFLVTAKNWNGCKSIFKKLTLANRQYFNGRPRLFVSQLFDFHDCFVSLACAISLLANDNWLEIGEKFHKRYGKDLYLELINASFKMKDRRPKAEIKENPIIMPDQAKIVNMRCIELHKRFGILLCATVDSHFTYSEQARAFETLLAIQTRSKMTEKTYDHGGKRFFFGDDNIYIKDGKEVFEDLISLGYLDKDIIIEAIENTNIIGKKCHIDMPKFSLNLPKPYKNEDDIEVFKKKIQEGFFKLGLNKKPNALEYKKRIFYEVDAIKKVGFVRYFLIMTDIMDYCRENGIATGSCRGSCGASIVLLCLGVIRRIDAIEHDLIFSRFINVERISFPDIDTDFSSKDRHKVVKYIEEKYGKENVCGISTYTYLSAKNAFRDVCSANNFSSKEINRLSKLIEDGVIKKDGKIVGNYSRIESFDHVPELKAFKKSYPDLFNIIKILDGRVRGVGCHAAAIICSSIPLHDFGPVMFRKGGYCIAYDKKKSEDMFCMLKIDALGLKTIDVTNTACKFISNKIGKKFTTDEIPLNDKETELMVSNGDTIGVFQFENSNARRSLSECKNGTLNAQAGISSAIRPGVIAAKDENGISATTHYINKLNGSEEESYYIEEFKNILSDTKGELLFQEQVMRTCSQVAGFSESESDNMRRLIGKKCTIEEFEKIREKFVNGCLYHSEVPIEKSNHIFDNFVKSSSYLFNKAHATGYAILSMESAYLKRHHPVEFFCAVLTYAGKEEKFQDYIKDAKRHGVDILYPDINKSNASEFAIHDKKVLAPLNSIKGVGDVAANFIVQARPEEGFKSYDNFLNILTEKKLNGKINKRVKNILYRANAFKSLNFYEEDKQQRRNNLRELLGLFSPIPSINFKSGRRRDDTEYKELINKTKQCSRCSEFGNFVPPLGYKSPSIFVILGLSKFDSRLFQNNNTSWYFNHLKSKLDVPKSAFYFTADVKCSHYGIEKIDINSKCKTQCKAFLKREIEIIRPKLIINTVSWLSPCISGVKGLRFQESFGSVFFNGDLDSFAINSPSPQWVSFSEEIKERYKKEVIPLLESLKNDQG